MNAGRYSQATAKLADSGQHGPDCELFLVEGDSAARSVVAVRNDATQAVLPLQGKPMNAWRADAAKVRANVLFRQIAAALGINDPTMDGDAVAPAPLRFGRVVLLFDPDADGMHIGALMLLYFARWMPDLIAGGQVLLVRPPMFTLTDTATGETMEAYSPAHLQALRAQLAANAESDAHSDTEGDGGAADSIDVHRYLGLGSLSPALLRRSCVDPATRAVRVVNNEDVDAVLQAFLPAAGQDRG